MKVLTQKQLDALAFGRRKGRKIDLSSKIGMKYKKHKENPTSFKKGQKPWNTGKKGMHSNLELQESRSVHIKLHHKLRGHKNA